jgi:phosphoserine phosphatase
LGHELYIISGGLAEPVQEFGRFLGVPTQNIRAVGIEYDSLSGEWWYSHDEQPNASERYLTFDQVPLTVSDGKARIVEQLLDGSSGRSLLVGDGVSDLHAAPVVDLFVGFGGVVERQSVRLEAPIYISVSSLAPLLAIAAGPAALLRLEDATYRPLLTRVFDFVANGAIQFSDEALKDRFYHAWRSTY